MSSRYTVQPYGSVLTFVSTREEYDALAYESLAEDAQYSGAFCQHWKRSAVYVLGVFDGSLFTLVHEAVHAASAILTECGIDPQSNSAEPLAYLVGHLTKEGAKRLQICHTKPSHV